MKSRICFFDGSPGERLRGMSCLQRQFVAGGFTHGLNAPPGTAEATGLSKLSALTEETPNTQSSTRMPSRMIPNDRPPSEVSRHSRSPTTRAQLTTEV